MNKLIKLLFLAAFINAFCWLALTPPFQYPDEQSHFAQVQNIAEQKKFRNFAEKNTSLEISLTEEVLQTSRDGLGNNSYTYHPEFKPYYSNTLTGPSEDLIRNLPKSSRLLLVKKEATENPPLYYILSQPAYQSFYSSSILERLFAVRIVSLVLFIANIFVAYLISKIIFDEEITQITLTSLIAFMPMLIHASTGVLPDALTNFLFSLVLFFTLKLIGDGIINRNFFLLIGAILLGYFTRQQFPISISIALLAIGIRLLKEINIKTLSLLVLASLIFSIFIFSGALPIPEVSKLNLSQLLSYEFVIHIKSSLQLAYSQTLPWYWGVYKWLSLTAPDITYEVINRLLIISAVGLIFYAGKRIKDRWKSKDKYFAFLLLSSIAYFLVLLVWEFYHIKTHGYPFGFQGRYYFPLVIAHMSLILLGQLEFAKIFLKRNLQYFHFFLILLMVIFSNISLFHLISSYYDLSSFESFITSASQYKPLFFKGSFIILSLTVSLGLQVIFLFRLLEKCIKLNFGK